MKVFNTKIGVIHFIGIGGIGMSGIAEVMHVLNFTITGSDISENNNINRLRKVGVKIFIGHKEQNISEASVVVISSAINSNNIELEKARKKRIPIVKRAEMLAELMRFKNTIAIGGTHGKTTSTSLIAAILEKARLDPTVINGGIINAYSSNARLGSGDWMIVEADESDGSFLKLPSTVVVVTNIDPEHLDYFGHYDKLKNAFRKFINNIPFYGFAVVCIDNSTIQSLMTEISDRRIITYGLSPQADVRAINLEQTADGTKFTLEISANAVSPKKVEHNLYSKIPGIHNVQNVLASCAVCNEIGISFDDIKNGLLSFQGVSRRFSILYNEDDIKIIDDYGHHPTEIKAVLSAARDVTRGKVIAIIQPHRYSRIKALFSDFMTAFNDSDILFISDIYSAGEKPLENINKESFIRALNSAGHKDVRSYEGTKSLLDFSLRDIYSGDTIIFLGAGDITNWAKEFQTLFLKKRTM